MLACHCLNVIIEIEGDLQKVEIGTLEVSPEEENDHFFQDVRQVGKLIHINKSHSGLIQVRNLGPWAIHWCINCGIHSHAVHRDKGASCVLVNSKLFSRDTIEQVKNSDNFSQLYKIIIEPEDTEDENLAANYVLGEVENVVKGLKQVAVDALKLEAVKVEERIRQFSDEQYSKLSAFRERTFREQQMLIKIILSSLDTAVPASTNSGMSTPQGVPSRLNEPLAAGSGKMTSSPSASSHLTRPTPKRQKSCRHPSLDTEGLFEFEGIDDAHSETVSELDESDVEAERGETNDAGAKAPRRAISVAKSLPMSIPAFLNETRFPEDVDEASPPFQHDIAASIKALAQSVHGDTVFGDLPKPRYTYI